VIEKWRVDWFNTVYFLHASVMEIITVSLPYRTVNL